MSDLGWYFKDNILLFLGIRVIRIIQLPISFALNNDDINVLLAEDIQ